LFGGIVSPLYETFTALLSMYPIRHSLSKTTISIAVMILFSYVILHEQQLVIAEGDLQIHEKFVSTKDISYDSSIQLNTVELVPIEAGDAVTKHVVKRWQSIGYIASKYGTTVSKIREINNIQGNIVRVGQEIFISDVPGIIHAVKKDTNFLVFADKYELDLEDLMTLNYVINEETIMTQGSEVFLPITIEKAYELWIEEKPKPRPKPVIVKKPKPIVASKPVVTKASPSTEPKIIAKKAVAQVAQKPAPKPKPAWWPYAGKVEASRWDGSTQVQNGFYKGYCTYRAAKKRPDIFPYTSPTSQSRPFGGNAKVWLANAQAAGLPTWSSPAPWAIAVFAVWWPGYASYGHVGIVMKIDRERRLFLMEEMNGKSGKGYVDHRWIRIDDGNIRGYIY